MSVSSLTMTRRWFAVVVVLTAFALITIIVTLHSSSFRIFSLHLPPLKSVSKENRSAVNRARLQKIKQTCPNRSRVHSPAKGVHKQVERIDAANFVVNREHRVVYCFIPKVATSTIKRVFAVLAGRSNGTSLFNISSTGVHHGQSPVRMYDTLKDVLPHANYVTTGQFLRASKKFIFVRDPYERLFSAYISRVFTDYAFMKIWIERFVFKKWNGTRCGLELTLNFADIINYVANSAPNAIESHFSSYHRRCLPCGIHYDFVGKVETMREDLEFILSSLGLQPPTLLGDHNSFVQRSDVSTLRDVTERAFEYLKMRNRCFTRYRLLKRTWVEFQVRGYLPISEPFPLSEEAASTVTLTQFHDLVQMTYKKIKDRQWVKQQRQQAVMEAYYSVPRALLLKLQKVLQKDCDLFGYECDVNVRFPEANRPMPVFHLDKL